MGRLQDNEAKNDWFTKDWQQITWIATRPHEQSIKILENHRKTQNNRKLQKVSWGVSLLIGQTNLNWPPRISCFYHFYWQQKITRDSVSPNYCSKHHLVDWKRLISWKVVGIRRKVQKNIVSTIELVDNSLEKWFGSFVYWFSVRFRYLVWGRDVNWRNYRMIFYGFLHIFKYLSCLIN